jgi:hypothetical protein
MGKQSGKAGEEGHTMGKLSEEAGEEGHVGTRVKSTA